MITLLYTPFAEEEEYMSRQVVLGIDGGGTHTRAAVVDIQGNVISYVERGSSSLDKDLKARDNAQRAIIEAVEKAGCSLCDIVGLAAGIAGYNSEEDLVWVRELTQVDGLKCSCWHVNDAVVAHIGAFLFRPGIIAISGTGSIIFGITEEGKQLSNYDFHHYAYTAARHLSYDAVYKIIAGETDNSDYELVNQVLKYFDCEDIPGLSAFAANGFIQDRRERDKFFGDMAPIITEAAFRGSRLAKSVCDGAATALATGIRLVGSCFSSQTVLTAFVGSVINSAYIKQTLESTLSKSTGREYKMIGQVLPGVFGAVILALKNSGLTVNEQILKNLNEYSRRIL